MALARLLETQPKRTAKARPPREAEVTPEPAPEPPRPSDERQPPAAEFLLEDVEASAAADLAPSSSVPRFEKAPPPDLGEFSLLAARHGDLSRGGPRTAVFVPDTPKAQSVNAPVQNRQKSAFKRPTRELQLEEGAAARGSAGEARRPAGSGFIFKSQLPADLPAEPRRTAKARFAPLPRPSVVSAGGRGSIPGPVLRPARLISSSAPQRTAPGKFRPAESTPRWRRLEPVLPVQDGGKITLVLGTFAQRPIRLATQDRLPDLFEMQFLPISFPQYAARMGSLDERLHRTDRIGFTPP